MQPRFVPVRTRKRTSTSHLLLVVVLTILIILFQRGNSSDSEVQSQYATTPLRPELWPVEKTLKLPRGRASNIPKVQHKPVPESPVLKAQRERRLKEVRDTFLHAWNGYKKEAWAQDELRPVRGGYKNKFCGWAATLVDNLDTLLIMELYEEFDLALVELAKIDFTGTEGCQVNLFETTIRHLGGLLSAYDLSGGRRKILIEKAVELGEILFSAFDTPNRMPSPHYTWSATNPNSHNHQPSGSVVLAVLGTLSLEFTRLSQITGDDKYYDGIQRIINELEKWQPSTSLPGMWPAIVDSTGTNETLLLGSPPTGGNDLYTLGALADSAYEYFPKVSSDPFLLVDTFLTSS